MDSCKVAVIGATGAVGQVFLKIAEERKFPREELRLGASERSLGKKLKFNAQKLKFNAPKCPCYKIDIQSSKLKSNAHTLISMLPTTA